MVMIKRLMVLLSLLVVLGVGVVMVRSGVLERSTENRSKASFTDCEPYDLNGDSKVDATDLALARRRLSEREIEILGGCLGQTVVRERSGGVIGRRFGGDLDEVLADEGQTRLLQKLLNRIDFPWLDLTKFKGKLTGGGGQLGKSEVMVKDEAGNPKLVRVFVGMGFRPLENLGMVGNWVYFVKGRTGVTMLDAGSRYSLLALLRYGIEPKDLVQALATAKESGNLDMNSLMALVDGKKRCSAAEPLNDNMKYMMETVVKYFPNDKVSQIILTHWHWDHAENATFVKDELARRQGLRPVIRMHPADKLYPDVDGSTMGAEKVFTDACASKGSWVWGADVEDGEELDGSGLRVVYTPGHTFGFISFVSDVDRLAIAGPTLIGCREQKEKETEGTASPLDESPKDDKPSCGKLWGMVGSDYRMLNFHPDVGGGSKSSLAAMVGGKVGEVAKSKWADSHRYGDCKDQNSAGIWPSTIASLVDCTLPDKMGGPSDRDKQVAPEQAGLYYKHLSPVDMLTSISAASYVSIIKSLKPQDGSSGGVDLKALMNVFYPIVEEDPARFAKASLDSFMVGIGGDANNSESLVKSVSLMVHPGYERPIVGAIGLEQRVKNLYLPFVEEAVGGKVDVKGVQELYEAALNQCGGKAIDGNQGGLGKKLEMGNFVVSVQLWPTGDTTGDCNLHVVAK